VTGATALAGARAAGMSSTSALRTQGRGRNVSTNRPCLSEHDVDAPAESAEILPQRQHFDVSLRVFANRTGNTVVGGFGSHGTEWSRAARS